MLTNAFKYARNEIWVSAGEAVVEGAVMLEISVGDDGPGVTETEAAKILSHSIVPEITVRQKQVLG